MTPEGKLKMPQNLKKANLQKKVEYMSVSHQHAGPGAESSIAGAVVMCHLGGLHPSRQPPEIAAPSPFRQASQRNFSMGQTPHYTNEARAREALDYLDAFNSKICASTIEHRTHYGEFSKFVHENGKSYHVDSDMKC